MRFTLPLVAAAIALGSAGAASSATPELSAEDRADANCLAAISIVAPNVKEEDQAGLASILTYFLGKLKGRHPEIKLADVMTPDLLEAVADNIQAEAMRCSQEGAEMGNDLKATGDALTKAGY